MKLYSTKNTKQHFSFEYAVMQGIAPDGGLFMPLELPVLPGEFFRFEQNTFQSLCFDLASFLLSDSIPVLELERIITKSMTFSAPLVTLSDQISVLELWHGPSLAFKDFGAQFMAQVMSYFNREHQHPLNILVATSGDTGGAVAAGFHKVPGINVIILYPKGKVSHLQEKQLTTFGDNITALEIKGTFDDCQALVKQAFADPSLTDNLRLTSANSINIARLIPQMFYYFEAFRLRGYPSHNNVVFSVPSGNFGNLTAGLFSKKMGLPINKFIASTNINDIVPSYLKTGEYIPRRSVETLANAMDVGNPSNFMRMLHLYGSTWNNLKQDIIGYSYNDDQTVHAIRTLYNNYQYTADPHSAIAFLGLNDFINDSLQMDIDGIFLETAHPSKFKTTIDQALQTEIAIHPNLLKAASSPGSKFILPVDYHEIHSFLLDNFAN
ncbi:MAG: threonine synthase [Saprospiraceae bacterium]|nr:threonine synthase [Saprospiraceae bacterium]